MTTEEERIERLEKALAHLVWFRFSNRLNEPGGWCALYAEDSDVDDIIGDLLDEYKPKDITDPRP